MCWVLACFNQAKARLLHSLEFVKGIQLPNTTEYNRDYRQGHYQGHKDDSRRRYSGFTRPMFDECWLIQSGKCGLCDRDLTGLKTQQIHADHEPDSQPKKPRGILCSSCNNNWLGRLEYWERVGDCNITSPKILEWQTNPPMSRSTFAAELGWT